MTWDSREGRTHWIGDGCGHDLDDALAGTTPEPVTATLEELTDEEFDRFMAATGHGRSITIRIDGRPPTPNARRHWRVTALDNETWKGAARVVAVAAKPAGWTPLARATAEVTFIVPDRKPRDLDNLVASSKPLTDGLVAAGVLLDDSTRVLTEIRYRTEYRKGETATVYELREAA